MSLDIMGCVDYKSFNAETVCRTKKFLQKGTPLDIGYKTECIIRVESIRRNCVGLVTRNGFVTSQLSKIG